LVPPEPLGWKPQLRETSKRRVRWQLSFG